MRAVLDIVLIVLNLATLVIIAQAIMSWLLASRRINLGNPTVASIWNTLNAITEPVLRPIRRIMPRTGALDLSPLVLILAIIFIQRVIRYDIYPNVI